MSPWVLAAIGIGISLANILIRGRFDLYILAFFFLAAVIEIFARMQKKVPSILITFIASLTIIIFLRTHVIMIKTISNSSAEPYIQKGAVVFYQPSFFTLRSNDLIVIKNYQESRSLICKVLEVIGQTYKVEVISRNQTIETSKDNIEGKIVYATRGDNKQD
jgi:signal peptidase I